MSHFPCAAAKYSQSLPLLKLFLCYDDKSKDTVPIIAGDGDPSVWHLRQGVRQIHLVPGPGYVRVAVFLDVVVESHSNANSCCTSDVNWRFTTPAICYLQKIIQRFNKWSVSNACCHEQQQQG